MPVANYISFPVICPVIWYVMSPGLFLFLEITVSIQSLLHLHRFLRLLFSKSEKKVVVILTGLALFLQITLGTMDILIISIFLIETRGIVKMHIQLSTYILQFPYNEQILVWSLSSALPNEIPMP